MKSTRSRQAADDAILDRSTALDDLRCLSLSLRHLLGKRLSIRARCISRTSRRQASPWWDFGGRSSIQACYIGRTRAGRKTHLSGFLEGG